MENSAERNSKLEELHTLQSIQRDLEDALQTDCNVFAAQQSVQALQAQLQNLRLEYDFLAANYGFAKQKLDAYTAIVSGVCDFLKCAPDEILGVLAGERALRGVCASQCEAPAPILRESELNREADDLFRSVAQLTRKYHSDTSRVAPLADLRLNSEKIINDRAELLE